MSPITIRLFFFIVMIYSSIADQDCSVNNPCPVKDNIRQLCIEGACYPVAKNKEKCFYDGQCQAVDSLSICQEDPKKEKTCVCKHMTTFIQSENACQINGYCREDTDCSSGLYCSANHCQEKTTSGWVYVFSTLGILALIILVGVGFVWWRGRH